MTLERECLDSYTESLQNCTVLSLYKDSEVSKLLHQDTIALATYPYKEKTVHCKLGLTYKVLIERNRHSEVLIVATSPIRLRVVGSLV